MNKFTHTTYKAYSSLRSLIDSLRDRLRGESYRAQRGPQWQQLELPFSRTPVRKWNR